MSTSQAGSIIKKANKFENGLLIETTKIVPGNSTPVVSKIESPEGFFPRNGIRAPRDKKVGQPYKASGYIKLDTDGTITIGKVDD